MKCLGCGSTKIKEFFESRYGGLRGGCTNCGSNFPLS